MNTKKKKTKTNKTYLELANERAERRALEKALKIELERDKFNHQKRKDVKNGIITIVAGLPILILVITFVIIGLCILGGMK